MSIIPKFDYQLVVAGPWTTDFDMYGWMMLMGFLVTLACGLVGNFLIWRRMALVGDAISHSILPGLVVAFIALAALIPDGLDGEQSEAFLARWKTPAMFIGAVLAALVTVVIIEVIHQRTRVKQDAAIGIAFTSLFAIGVLLINRFAANVDLDQECVLYGELEYIPLEASLELAGITLGPIPLVRMAVVAVIVVLLIILFYKELLVTSFDPNLAFSIGVNPAVVHYGLMVTLAVVVVSAFESVGAILVVGMLILPGATAALISQRLKSSLWMTALHAALSAVLGVHLSLWLNSNSAAAMVIVGTALFALAWAVHAVRGALAMRGEVTAGFTDEAD
jgi:manganese/zinc/iron transport system permease protein